LADVERSPLGIKLRVPVLTMLLAATAVPVDLQLPKHLVLSLGIFPEDVLSNIAGYLPAGVVLGDLGVSRAVAVASLMSALAETGQLFMMHRQPSAVDIVCNVIGAALGAMLIARSGMASPTLMVTRRKALVAATLAVALVIQRWGTAGFEPNVRGAISPGTLEAHWTFDETEGRIARDSSGHGLHGKFSGEPKRVAGVRGRAAMLDGTTDYVDFERSTDLRLTGSMTASAWIKATAFPADDAAIISNHNGLGYQLDATVDRGPRTIGFKLADACGELMARYGSTPLVVDRWYHVAGVYDAASRSLHVYLDGKLDDGFLFGSVTGTQHSSGESVYVGRRSSNKGFEFAGLIDDVRVYSRALTRAEIEADLIGTSTDPAGIPVPDAREEGGLSRRAEKGSAESCTSQADLDDARTPGVAVIFGVLVAFACTGLWPSNRAVLSIALSGAAGILLLFVGTPPTMPLLGRWMVPLTTLAGGVSVAAGRLSAAGDDHIGSAGQMPV
jgi:concanavalin A-like lectin/glucanase superfamily protein/VanZ like protein